MSISSVVRILPLALALAACTPTTSTTGAKGASSAAGSDSVVATFDGQSITLGELDASLGAQLYEMRHDALEDMVLRRLVDAEAKKQGKDAGAMLDEIAKAAVANPSDAELQALYTKYSAQLGGKSFDEVKPMLAAHATQQARQQAVMAYLDGLKKTANVQILLPEPRIDVAATGPAMGPENAPVTIITFSDFQCPYCSRAVPTVERVVKEYGDKVRLVFRNFPLSFHDKAEKAAEAGACANEQGKFWEMHNQMFAHQDQLEVPALKQAAATLGLDAAKFDSCLDSGKFAAEIQKDIADGKKAGVNGTPAFFVNGRMLSGAQSYDKFKEAIDKALKDG